MNLVRHRVCARFGLMHMVATNMCIWIRTVIEETYRDAIFGDVQSSANVSTVVAAPMPLVSGTPVAPSSRHVGGGIHSILDARSGGRRLHQFADNVSTVAVETVTSVTSFFNQTGKL